MNIMNAEPGRWTKESYVAHLRDVRKKREQGDGLEKAAALVFMSELAFYAIVGLILGVSALIVAF
jgi:hypothetical protein